MTDDSDTSKTASQEPTGQTHVCRATGREQGLVGKYDIWLCRQAFREMAPAMGFEKHE
ncbi:MAG: SSU ribosomal protein S14P [uncultured archaeon A07HN63]|jgi:SSU ribosomal protein S14P|nr:MAG: SSU ribosomal protein S14P [uncultured archaeon A07HN63]